MPPAMSRNADRWNIIGTASSYLDTGASRRKRFGASWHPSPDHRAAAKGRAEPKSRKFMIRNLHLRRRTGVQPLPAPILLAMTLAICALCLCPAVTRAASFPVAQQGTEQTVKPSGALLSDRLLKTGKPSSAGSLTSLPAVVREAVSRGLGADRRAYRAVPVQAGILMKSGGGVEGSFNSLGGSLSVGGDDRNLLQLRLSGVGRGNHIIGLATVLPSHEANKVTYARPGISEWYANGPLGVEQGLSIASRPAGTGTLALRVGTVPSNVHPRFEGRTLVLNGSLRFGDLTAQDASGRTVPSHLAVVGRNVEILVNDRSARYPITIDPLAQLALLTSSRYENGGLLGYSIAVSDDGSVVAAGAPMRNGDEGAVYVFTKHQGGWISTIQQAILTPSDGGTDWLGEGLAISGDGKTIIAGAPLASANMSGALYVFNEPVSGWADETESATLQLSNQNADQGFEMGGSVSMSDSGATVAATVPTTTSPGEIAVFGKPNGGWTNSTTQSPVPTHRMPSTLQ